MEVSGAQVTGVKQAEMSDGLIIRLHNAESEASSVKIRMANKIKDANLVSVTEKPVCCTTFSIEEDSVCMILEPNSIASVLVCM